MYLKLEVKNYFPSSIGNIQFILLFLFNIGYLFYYNLFASVQNGGKKI